MKSFALLLSLSATMTCALPALTTPPSWEAESGRLSGRAVPIKDRSASAGAALHLDSNGRVVWTVQMEKAGRYELHFRYRTRLDAVWPTLDVNGRIRGLGLTSTFGEWQETSRIVGLNAGANTIALASDDASFDVDLVRFTMLPRAQVAPLDEIPMLTPRQARVDLRDPQPLQFLLQRNGHRAPRVTLGGREIQPIFTDYEDIEDAVRMDIPAESLAAFPAGPHTLRVAFADGAETCVRVDMGTDSLAAPLLIAALEVSHGKATLLRLPDGEVALIDCAQHEFAKSHLLPFLAAHHIERIDHLFITHYHDDHVGGLKLLQATLPIGQIHDYKNYHTGEKFELGGAEWFVLNAYDAGDDENSRSLALQVTYHGFVYTDGADNYGSNQVSVMEKFPGRVRSHVYNANHHFHGSVDVNYLRRTDAVLYLISAEKAVYARAAYADHFLREVEGYLKAHNGRMRESLLTAEVGNTLIRVHDADHWTYETLPVGAAFPDFLPPK